MKYQNKSMEHQSMKGKGPNNSASADNAEISEELIAVVRRWITALETKDSEVLTALFSNSASLR
jgi:hypothetical protein